MFSAGRRVGVVDRHTEIDVALGAAASGQGDVVRIVGNGGLDGDLSTLIDNEPYLIGFDNFGMSLPDVARMEVPKGVTVMIDAGALFKMQKANIEVGSSTDRDLNQP